MLSRGVRLLLEKNLRGHSWAWAKLWGNCSRVSNSWGIWPSPTSAVVPGLAFITEAFPLEIERLLEARRSVPCPLYLQLALPWKRTLRWDLLNLKVSNSSGITTIKQDKLSDNTSATNLHPVPDHVRTLTSVDCTLKPFHIVSRPSPLQKNSSPLKKLRVGELWIRRFRG